VGEESKYKHKRHNVNVLLYHLVCSAKYRRVIFSDEVDGTLKNICMEIAKRYDITFLEIGTDEDHVHFLIQTDIAYSLPKVVRTIKSITAKELFKEHPEIKQQLWGGEFWGKGYFINTVGQHSCETEIAEYVKNRETEIAEYVKNQGNEKEYKKIHSQQLNLF